MTTQLKPRPSQFPGLAAALRAHWPLYFYEGAELATFMLSACLVTAVLYAPGSPAAAWDAVLRRLLMGAGMGLTAVAILKSPWGKRSGGHFNPAISLTFYRVGKIGPWDTCCYVVAQFAGAPIGVLLATLLLGARIRLPQVEYAVTVPRQGSVAGAFAAEAFMAAMLMAVVLVSSNSRRWAPFTTWMVGLLIAGYVFLFAPVSGFSINPARTFGSAVVGEVWTGVWIYFTAPLLGMFAAAELYVRAVGPRREPYFTHRHLQHRG